MIGLAFAGVYGLWAMFCMPGLRVPFRPKFSYVPETDLSKYRNVMVFLAPAVMGVLEEKLLKELPEDARLIVCRFPFPRWPHSCTAGSGLNQVCLHC
ncbi:putative protein FAM173A-like [Triplophysa rosa]|uniref:Uncharacterized protein n=1 Tax=Triplophysa rosa TaxID=992332 RepID=A0A9W7TAF5_TRIRA|nr:putative protein FAM173A-like [Triplophysa rosa]